MTIRAVANDEIDLATVGKNARYRKLLLSIPPTKRVVVQLWINAKWHAAILKSGATLQDSADEAFALLMAKRRGKSR